MMPWSSTGHIPAPMPMPRSATTMSDSLPAVNRHVISSAIIRQTQPPVYAPAPQVPQPAPTANHPRLPPQTPQQMMRLARPGGTLPAAPPQRMAPPSTAALPATSAPVAPRDVASPAPASPERRSGCDAGPAAPSTDSFVGSFRQGWDSVREAIAHATSGGHDEDSEHSGDEVAKHKGKHATDGASTTEEEDSDEDEETKARRVREQRVEMFKGWAQNIRDAAESMVDMAEDVLESAEEMIPRKSPKSSQGTGMATRQWSAPNFAPVPWGPAPAPCGTFPTWAGHQPLRSGVFGPGMMPPHSGSMQAGPMFGSGMHYPPTAAPPWAPDMGAGSYAQMPPTGSLPDMAQGQQTSPFGSRASVPPMPQQHQQQQAGNLPPQGQPEQPPAPTQPPSTSQFVAPPQAPLYQQPPQQGAQQTAPWVPRTSPSGMPWQSLPYGAVA